MTDQTETPETTDDAPSWDWNIQASRRTLVELEAGFRADYADSGREMNAGSVLAYGQIVTALALVSSLTPSEKLVDGNGACLNVDAGLVQ